MTVNEQFFKSSLIYSRTNSYFYCFILLMVAPFTCWFSYGKIMDRFVIVALFWVAALIRGRPLFETWPLLEEVREAYYYYKKPSKIWKFEFRESKRFTFFTVTERFIYYKPNYNAEEWIYDGGISLKIVTVLRCFFFFSQKIWLRLNWAYLFLK